MSGFDQQDDEVQTLAYSCITGLSINNVCKETGIKFANKLGIVAIKKVPYDTLQIINKKLAFKFVTKFGEKGLINLGKMVPLLGGVVGSLFDLVSTKVITAKAKKDFLSRGSGLEQCHNTPSGSTSTLTLHSSSLICASRADMTVPFCGGSKAFFTLK